MIKKIDGLNYEILENDYETYLRYKNTFNETLNDNDYETMSKYRRVGFGYMFNQKLENLPSNIEELRLGESFDQPIDLLQKPIDFGFCCFYNFLTNLRTKNYTLKKLVITGKFNHSIDNLPDSIEYLEIIGFFNQPINKLPANLKYLKIVGKFNQNIKSFPSGLEYFILTNPDYSYKLGHLPIYIKTIHINNKYKYINESLLKYLDVKIYFSMN